ncbi:hypothetical protein [Chryseobacterium balustinum]|uniref:Uncharacterized protein n=1 Tax=Chryseobacterium balustinum TaxID=246 RepID=A0AAX2ITE7_9FLAO|nr:hypothetical protein [Chryseobacterium balustinum]AZB28459.1 hypothetical protein EB354_03820 [Chryseobacterium balustinum]SKC13099.1 hypothetical protein SAMN05421800_1448 [Chryseobacterium balustinum]SQA92549.1 Uncharacterised protein [Chryseobacterium balustinum]
MYKEFGFWKEYGDKYKDYPSINLYINKDINDLYDKSKLIPYLNFGGIIAVSSKINFPHLFKSQQRLGEFLLLTDGFWVWPEDLAEYVLNYNVILPTEWYDLILSNNYRIPEKIKFQQQDVEWVRY